MATHLVSPLKTQYEFELKVRMYLTNYENEFELLRNPDYTSEKETDTCDSKVNRTTYNLREHRKMGGFYDEKIVPINFERKHNNCQSKRNDTRPLDDEYLYKQNNLTKVNRKSRERKFRQNDLKSRKNKRRNYSGNKVVKRKLQNRSSCEKRSTKNEVKTSSKQTISRRLRCCIVCGRGFCRRSDLNAHTFRHRLRDCFQFKEFKIKTRRHVAGRLFKCHHCSKGFSRKKDLSRHIKKINIKPEIDNPKQKDFTSNIVADLKSEVLQTSQSIISESKILSRHCVLVKKRKTRKQNSNIKRSIWKRNTPKVRCKICKRSYAPHNLVAHARTHSGDKPYTCNVCGKQFSQLGNMEVHTRVHTDFRPYVCPLCPQSFKQLAQVQAHFRFHKSGRGVKCERCGALYGQVWKLNKHLCPDIAKVENKSLG